MFAIGAPLIQMVYGLLIALLGAIGNAIVSIPAQPIAEFFVNIFCKIGKKISGCYSHTKNYIKRKIWGETQENSIPTESEDAEGSPVGIAEPSFWQKYCPRPRMLCSFTWHTVAVTPEIETSLSNPISDMLEELKQLNVNIDNYDIPERFICRITKKIMTNPCYIATDPELGYFDMGALAKHLRSAHTSPLAVYGYSSSLSGTSKRILPCYALQAEILQELTEMSDRTKKFAYLVMT